MIYLKIDNKLWILVECFQPNKNEALVDQRLLLDGVEEFYKKET